MVLPSWEESRRAGRRVYFNYTPLIPRALSLSLSSSFPTFTRSLARPEKASLGMERLALFAKTATAFFPWYVRS